MHIFKQKLSGDVGSKVKTENKKNMHKGIEQKVTPKGWPQENIPRFGNDLVQEPWFPNLEPIWSKAISVVCRLLVTL